MTLGHWNEVHTDICGMSSTAFSRRPITERKYARRCGTPVLTVGVLKRTLLSGKVSLLLQARPGPYWGSYHL